MQNHSGGGKKNQTSASGLDVSGNAAALQQHFASQLGFSLRGPKLVKSVPKLSSTSGVKKESSNASTITVSSSSSSSSNPSSSSYYLDGTNTQRLRSSYPDNVLLNQLSDRWLCEHCRNLNTGSLNQCQYCGQLHKKEKSTGRSSKTTTIHEGGSSLTLAQVRGLVPLPLPGLTTQQWKDIELRIQLRAEEKCSICMEKFSLRETVMTSCSHIFHKSCLDALEKFMLMNEKISTIVSLNNPTPVSSKCCPICRTMNYQRQRTRIGAHLYIQSCIVLVQALYRGKITRRIYFQLRRNIYLAIQKNSQGTDNTPDTDTFSSRSSLSLHSLPLSRKKAFVAEALQDLHKRLDVFNTKRNNKVKNVLHDIDNTLRLSREIMNRANQRLTSNPDDIAKRNTSSSSRSLSVVNGSVDRPGGTESDSNHSNNDGETALRLLDILAERLVLVEARQRRLANTRRIFAEQQRQLEEEQLQRRQREEEELVSKDPSPPLLLSRMEWIDIHQKSVIHTEEDCAVCIMPLAIPFVPLLSSNSFIPVIHSSSSSHSTASPPIASTLFQCPSFHSISNSNAALQPCTCAILLSCGHLFHQQCIRSLEKFMAGKSLFGISRTPEENSEPSDDRSRNGGSVVGKGFIPYSNEISRTYVTLASLNQQPIYPPIPLNPESGISKRYILEDTLPWPRCPLCRQKYWATSFHFRAG